MNAPLPEAIRKSLESVTLDDKYTLDRGRAFMSGVQALVRLPMLQRARDVAAGLNTAGFISGYRGSPLGGYDQALWAAKKHLAANHVVFTPGVNEELGATAVWGTQQLDLYPKEKKYDGVFGIWYGKGPGVDRSIDVFKHANMAGTARHGGVIAIAADDHVAKSSTAPHQSDHVFKACGFPTFFPSDVQGILDMGLHAFAMSRYSGVWTGMKTIQEVVESSSSVVVDPDRMKIVLPTDFEMPSGGLHIRWPDAPLEQEARLMDHKWYAALAYVRANKLNHNVIEGPRDRFGIIASGKAYNDTRQALADLGLDDATCRAVGVRLHKVNVVWPLEATITRDFAQGLQEILVVEEKRQIIEYQVKEELYNWRTDVRPNVLGKFDEPEGDATGGEWSRANPSDSWLLRAKADLTPAIIAKAIAKRLKKLGLAPAGSDVATRMDARIAVIEAREKSLAAIQTNTGERAPWFCSGCPHNTSTRVPEGSRAVAGIGCHYMAVWMDRSTSTFTQMGGEGVPWVGQQPFTNEKHIFANLGDGTYFHSGLLAIRQSIAAGVNITYKVLYNDAVAMTGGQQVGERPEGHSVTQIMNSLVSEGVKKLIIVTDQPEKYEGVTLADGVTVHHRDELDALQRQFRELEGTTVIIYDQTCATEKRRRRKRGKYPDPAKRVFINELVCEGCGDCGVKSNCVSVQPVETEFGRKREIDQSSCNKDYSCINGFCPSFVTVEGGRLRKPPRAAAHDFSELPDPVLVSCSEPYGILVTGIGGTGVVTIGALLGMAAHLEGKGCSVLDMTGLAQKNGAVVSHVRIAETPERLYATRIAAGEANFVLACDILTGVGYEALAKMQRGRTKALVNTALVMPADFTRDADLRFPLGSMEQEIKDAVGANEAEFLDATKLATGLMGDSIATNLFMVGFAYQRGRLPLSEASILRAIELNASAIESNKQSFRWGRLAAADPQRVVKAAIAKALPETQRLSQSPDELIDRRVKFLTDYHDAAYAKRYLDLVARVRAAEGTAVPGRTGLTEAVARYYFKLLAIKDEYEVARLYAQTDFLERVATQFEGDYTLRFHLAPPFTSRPDPATGVPRKRPYGPWMLRAMRVLAKLRGLRGTRLDVFGRTEERKRDRALIGEYEAIVAEIAGKLAPYNHALAVELAQVPEHIRGYGHVRDEHVKLAKAKEAELLARFRESRPKADERIPLVVAA